MHKQILGQTLRENHTNTRPQQSRFHPSQMIQATQTLFSSPTVSSLTGSFTTQLVKHDTIKEKQAGPPPTHTHPSHNYHHLCTQILVVCPKWTSAPAPNNYNNHSAEANTYFIKVWMGLGGALQSISSLWIIVTIRGYQLSQRQLRRQQFLQNWVRAVT